VLDPEVPHLIELVYGIPAPATPRNDLVAVFLTGVSGLNSFAMNADGGHADDRLVRLPYGCHGGSLAGNDSAIRSSIADSRANLPFSTEASGRRRIIRRPAKAATPEAASKAAPATVRRDRSRDLNHATPAGARAKAERARATVVRLFTAASFLLPCISEMAVKPAHRRSHDCCKCHPKSTVGGSEDAAFAPGRAAGPVQ